MSAVPAPRAIFGKAKYLALASAFEYGVQMLVPVFLVRTLSHEDFASYRFMWLLAGTLTTVLLLGFPASLYYFIPRASRDEQFGFVAQTAAFSAALAALWCALLFALVTFAPRLDFLRLLPEPLPAFFAFLVLIGATNVLDYLPAARAQVRAQAGLTVANAFWRAACTLSGAWFGSIEAVCWGLLAYAGGRLVLIAWYVSRSMPLRDFGIDVRRFRGQFAYAVPFGLASAFWSLRGQAEQWVGASILVPREYALLSIAGSIVPLVNLVRMAVTASIVSSINRLEANGDVAGMVRLNGAANVLATSYTYPVLTFFFVASGPLIALVYTPAYADAAMATKLICVGLLGSTIEMTTLSKALRMRRATLQFEAVMLMGSIAASLAGGLAFGFVGVVLGSVVSRYVSTLYYMAVLVKRTSVPMVQFQEWGALLRCLACSLAAGAAGWGALRTAADLPLVGQVAAVVVVLAPCYLLLARLFGVALPLPRTGE
jgi:O-antigen/teichoic acid export membrane protein